MLVRQLGRVALRNKGVLRSRASLHTAEAWKPKGTKWIPAVVYGKKNQKSIMDEAKKLKRTAALEDLIKMSEHLLLSRQWNKNGLLEMPDIQEAMRLYQKHKDILDDEVEVAFLLHALCNTARMPLKVFMSETKDNRAVLRERVNYQVCNYLDIIAHDLETGAVSVKPKGVMMLIAGYYACQAYIRGIDVYNHMLTSATAANNDKLVQKLQDPDVCGAVLDCMLASGSPLEQCEQLYHRSREQSGTTAVNLEHNMCRAYLRAGEVDKALNVFSNLVSSNLPSKDHQYLDRIHNSFIQFCPDVSIARKFFDEAIAGSTPYKVTVHPKPVHELMIKMTTPADCAEADFDGIMEIWQKFLENNKRYSESQFRILSYQLFQALLAKYPTYSEEGFEKLKSITSTYSDICGLSNTFINTLLTCISKHWREPNVILGVIESYDKNGVPIDLAASRIILNSFRYIDVPLETVQKWWTRRQDLGLPLEVLDFYSLSLACDAENRAEFFANTLKAAVFDGTLGDEDVLKIRNYATANVPSKRLNFILQKWPDLSDA